MWPHFQGRHTACCLCKRCRERGEEKRGRERTKREIGDRKRAERRENLEKESWLALRRERERARERMMKIRLERERLEIGNVCVCLPGVRITVCERDSVCVCTKVSPCHLATSVSLNCPPALKMRPKARRTDERETRRKAKLALT